MHNKKYIRDISMDILDEIKRLIIFYEMDIYYAKKYEKIKRNISRRNKRHSIIRFLFLRLTYGLYDGEPPTVEQCNQRYKKLVKPYVSILELKYWNIDVINELLNFLNRKKADNIFEAVALYEEKKRR